MIQYVMYVRNEEITTWICKQGEEWDGSSSFIGQLWWTNEFTINEYAGLDMAVVAKYLPKVWYGITDKNQGDNKLRIDWVVDDSREVHI